MGVRERTRSDGVHYFMLDFRDQQGVRVREAAGHYAAQADRRKAEQAALKLLAERKAAVLAGTFIRADEAAAPTFKDFTATFLKDYAAQRRSNFYRDQTRRLVAFFGKMEMPAITRGDIDRFRAERAAECGPSSVRKSLRVLSVMMKHAKRWGVIQVNPADDLPMPSQPKHKTRYLSAEEWKRLEDAAAPWLRPMLTLAVWTGMRLKEVTGLRWEDYDRERQRLALSEDNKTARSRTIPLGAGARTEMEKRVRHLRSGFVFVDAEGKDYHTADRRNRISKATTAAMRAAKIDGASFHTLRHTCASWQAQAGVPLHDIGAMLGHSTPLITAMYAHLSPDYGRRGVAALDSVFMDTRMDTAEGQVIVSR